MRRILSYITYLGMFPTFVIGSLCFYVALRARLVFLRGADRSVCARRFIHHGARLLFYLLERFGLVKVTVLGSAPASPGQEAAVIVANHPSMLDAMLLLSVVPNAACIMKRSLMRVPIVSGFARLAGYVPQSDAPEMFEAAADALKGGASLIIFPEGTRSPHGALGEFRRGAARISVETGAPVQGFAISMSPIVLGRGAHWLTPPAFPVQYQAVRIATREGELDSRTPSTPEEAREASIHLTRALEERVRNSLLSPHKASMFEAL